MIVRRAQLGSAASAVQAGGAAATAAVEGAKAAGAISAGTAAWAVPVIGAGVLAFSLWMSAVAKRNRQKVAATQIVDELEKQLAANRDAYLSGPRTVSAQRYALEYFDAALQWLGSQEGCGNPELGSAGRRCVSERQAGGRWDWTAYYRTPIASDAAQPDPLPAARQAVESLLETSGLNQAIETVGLSPNLALWGVAGLLALLLAAD